MQQEQGFYSEAQLEKFASEGALVYKYEHTKSFEPMSTALVTRHVDTILKAMKNNEDISELLKGDSDLKEFAENYEVLFKKLTDNKFISVPGNISIVRKMIQYKNKVDRGDMSSKDAERECSTMALAELVARNTKAKD